MRVKLLALVAFSILNFSCTDEDDTQIVVEEPQLIIKFKFDPTQIRLNNLGQPSTVSVGNATKPPANKFAAASAIALAVQLLKNWLTC